MNKYRKASGSTTSDDNYSIAAIINEQGDAMNKNAEIYANANVQQKSTTTILIIMVVGIAAYLFYLNQKKK